jgi:hypothetical protein
MAGEPIPGSEAKQYKMTWSHDRKSPHGYETYFNDSDPNAILAQANKLLHARQSFLKATAYYIHLVEIGGRTLFYLRGF